MANFHYKWWEVDVKYDTGVMTLVVKAKNKQNAIKQIKEEYKKSNSKENMAKPWYDRMNQIIEIY